METTMGIVEQSTAVNQDNSASVHVSRETEAGLRASLVVRSPDGHGLVDGRHREPIAFGREGQSGHPAEAVQDADFRARIQVPDANRIFAAADQPFAVA